MKWWLARGNGGCLYIIAIERKGRVLGSYLGDLRLGNLQYGANPNILFLKLVIK